MSGHNESPKYLLKNDPHYYLIAKSAFISLCLYWLLADTQFSNGSHFFLRISNTSMRQDQNSPWSSSVPNCKIKLILIQSTGKDKEKKNKLRWFDEYDLSIYDPESHSVMLFKHI